tara:strand:- start:360 stop:734 length:375 start_codon:yes stop_codon:yes gene_type:complete
MKLVWVKCWLLEGVDRKTAEVYYRFTTKFNRPVVFGGLDIGSTSYSKLVTGKQSTSTSVIHTIFANEMTEEMYEDAIAMNGNSNEFRMGIPQDETAEVSIVTQEEYAKIQADSSSDVFEQEQAQ